MAHPDKPAPLSVTPRAVPWNKPPRNTPSHVANQRQSPSPQDEWQKLERLLSALLALRQHTQEPEARDKAMLALAAITNTSSSYIHDLSYGLDGAPNERISRLANGLAPPPAAKKRGRPRGSGYQDADRNLLPEIEKRLTGGEGIGQICRDLAVGHVGASHENTAKRLERRFREHIRGLDRGR